MQNFVKYLKKEEDLEQQKKKAKVIKLADPTVFTISSPSAWQKPKLSSPDIVPAEVSFPGMRVADLQQVDHVTRHDRVSLSALRGRGPGPVSASADGGGPGQPQQAAGHQVDRSSHNTTPLTRLTLATGNTI